MHRKRLKDKTHLLFQNAKVFIREPDPTTRRWTGPGYMRVLEGDSIEFSGISVDLPMNYDIVIRAESWVSVK